MTNKRYKDTADVILALSLGVGAMKHLRIGQLIVNAVAGTGKDLFYIEDQELAEAIRAFCKKHTPSGGDDGPRL